MILDQSRLTVDKVGLRTTYIYNYPSDDKKILITLIAAEGHDGVKYVVDKRVEDLEGKIIINDDDNRFNTSDLKQAWEKFEDFFEETQKEENPQQGGEEPEIQILMVTVEKNGSSFVFLLKQDNTQELVLELNIDNYEIQNKKPKFAEIDFTNDPNLTEPFNSKWNLALVDDVKYNDASNDSTTFIIAIESIDQPGQNKESTDEPGEDKEDKPTNEPGEPKPTEEPGDGEPKQTDEPGDGEPKPTDEPGDGEPKPTEEPGDGEPKPTEEPGDDEAKPSNEEAKDIKSESKVSEIKFENIVKQISENTGLSPDNIEGALRTERIFDNYLTLNKINVNELKNKLNASDLTKNQFIKKIVSDFKNI